MNIPNFLTIIRILLVPVLVIFLMQGSYGGALAVFVIAGITDGLDGFLARILRQKTVLGSYLDPLADKALIATSFVTLSIMGAIPGWLAVIVLSRDFVILFGVSLLVLLSVDFEIRPVFVSKITTVLQILTVILVLLFQSMSKTSFYMPMHVFFWLTACFTVVSGLTYIYRGIQYVNHEGSKD